MLEQELLERRLVAGDRPFERLQILPITCHEFGPCAKAEALRRLHSVHSTDSVPPSQAKAGPVLRLAIDSPSPKRYPRRGPAMID